MSFIFISFFPNAYCHLLVTFRQINKQFQALFLAFGAEAAVCGVELLEQWLAGVARRALPKAVPMGGGRIQLHCPGGEARSPADRTCSVLAGLSA